MSTLSALTHFDATRRQPLRHRASWTGVLFISGICFLAPLSLSKTADAQMETDRSTPRAQSTEEESPNGTATPAPNDTATAGADEREPNNRYETSDEDNETLKEEDQQADTERAASSPQSFFNQRLFPFDYTTTDPETGEVIGAIERRGLTLQEAHDDTRTIRRRYALFTQRNTQILHKRRAHELDDELQQKLNVTLRFQQDDEDPQRIDVTVHRAEPHVSEPAAPLKVRIPSDGLQLHCWQRSFEVQCKYANKDQVVEWPQWATLDMNDWFSHRPVRSGVRWRRSISNPGVVGWLGDDGREGHIRTSLELSESGTNQADDTTQTQAEGTLDGDAELKVYHRRESFPINGQINIDFNHEPSLLHRLVVQWDGAINVSGLIGADTYRWERQTHTTLRVTSSIED